MSDNIFISLQDNSTNNSGSQTGNLNERRIRFFSIMIPLLENCENEHLIKYSDEQVFLHLLVGLWENNYLNRWLCKSRSTDFSEMHVLQTIGWMYDHMILLNKVSKTHIAHLLQASNTLRNFKSAETIRTNLSKPVPKFVDSVLKSIFM